MNAGARVVKVPLTKTYAHDVRAMLAAAPDAGVFYICTPNNPTGTLTSHADVEYLLANKPKNSIVLVDEAYIHFCDAPSAIDLVKAGKDIIVLRTFSKLYGMAGLRCGFAIARPDLMAEAAELRRPQSHAGDGGGGGVGQPSGSAAGRRAQAHQRRGPPAHLCLARPQRLLLHSIGIELLHARYRASGETGDRRHGPAERCTSDASGPRCRPTPASPSARRKRWNASRRRFRR